jgi:hypothetical protein
VTETAWSIDADGTPGPAMARCLRAAIAAPSIHNTQPWRFRLRGSAVDVLIDRERQLTVADPDGREMHVSVGAAVNNLRIAILAEGRTAVLRLLPEPNDSDLAATVTVGRPAPAQPHIRALAEAIPRRRTTRRPFWTSPALRPVLPELVEAATAEGGRLTILDDAARRTVLDVIRRAEERLRAEPEYQAELAAWTATDADRGDGVPPEAFGPRAQLAALPMRDFDPARTGRRPVAPFESEPIIAVLSTPGDTRRDWLIAGLALERVLLTATMHTVATAPLTQALEVPQLRRLLTTDHEPGMIQSVLRLGYAGSGPGTPRRALADVLVPNSTGA